MAVKLLLKIFHSYGSTEENDKTRKINMQEEKFFIVM